MNRQQIRSRTITNSVKWLKHAEIRSKNITNPNYGAIAQLGERLPCKQEVSGSIPLGSTNEHTHKSEEMLMKQIPITFAGPI